jgi:uncharacterized protein (TIGR02646 family)
MRYIDQDDVELLLPSDWGTKAAEALAYVEQKVKEARQAAIADGKSPDEIEAAVHKARAKAINTKSTLWSDAGICIRKVMHGKCWYCETKEIRSDMPVDHFRPKNSVVECPDHPGYWWLAFEWTNYRYSCTFCNSRRVDVENGTSGGKHDHFPLLPSSTWAKCPTDNWKDEKPLLLDPFNLDDVKLLTYHTNGYPRETCRDETREDYIRAKKSIYFFHLDHIKAVRERKTIAIMIKRHVQQVEDLLLVKDTQPSANDQIKFHKKEIIKMVREVAPLCTAARIYLQDYRAFEWVQEILDRNL